MFHSKCFKNYLQDKLLRHDNIFKTCMYEINFTIFHVESYEIGMVIKKTIQY